MAYTIGCNGATSTPVFHKGQLFASYDEVKEAIDAYSRKNYCKFWKRDSRTIKAAQKMLTRHLDSKLIYYEIKFACIHGGLQFKSSGKGIRHSSTFKMDCPVIIKFRASHDGKSLEVKDVCLEHKYHEVSKNLYQHITQKRIQDSDNNKKIRKLLHLGVNKKIVQHRMQKKSAKTVVLKDPSNSTAEKLDENDPNGLESCVKLLQETYNADVSVMCDQNNYFKGLYFATPSMKKSMEGWPEFLFIDGTFKLLKNGLTVCLLMVEDSNGQSQIVAVGIIGTEDRETFTWFLQTFQNENPSWVKTNTIMGRKDLLEHNIFNELFPDVPILICVCHTLRTFNREISRVKLKLTVAERIATLEILQQLVMCRSYFVYDNLFRKLKECAPQTVVTYFEKNWHGNRTEWSLCGMSKTATYKVSTNNMMEDMNGKIKRVVPENSSMSAFVQKFFKLLGSLEQKRNHRAELLALKHPITFATEGSPESKYRNFLTNFSYLYVLKQLSLTSKVKLPQRNRASKDIFSLESSSGKIQASCSTCTCSDRSAMLLPCRHIFAIRKLKKIDLFDEDLCCERWTKDYYKQYHIFNTKFLNTGDSQIIHENIVPHTLVKPKVPLTIDQKQKALSHVTSSLINTASMSSKESFQQKLLTLKTIDEFWSKGYEVSINIIDHLGTKVSLDKGCKIADYLEENTTDEAASLDNEDDMEYVVPENESAIQHDVDDVEYIIIEDGAATIVEMSQLPLIKMPSGVKRKEQPKVADEILVGLTKKKKKI